MLYYLISCDSNFQTNTGDKVSQLIFENIKTPAIKEVDSLGDTARGNKDMVQPESRLPQNQLSQILRMNQGQNQCPNSL